MWLTMQAIMHTYLQVDVGSSGGSVGTCYGLKAIAGGVARFYRSGRSGQQSEQAQLAKLQDTGKPPKVRHAFAVVPSHLR
jgi:hypothetical protein